MAWGALERNINFLRAASAKNGYRITLEMIADFIEETQRCKLDGHIIVGGQNGTGKSYLQLALAKVFLRRVGLHTEFDMAVEEGTLDFFFAYHKREDLARAIKNNYRCVFVIDELRPFFDYKRSITSAQTNLYNLVEVARARNHIYIGASRDYTKLDINYRNAKAQVLIYLFDKVIDPNKIGNDGFYLTKFTYGAVFVGNPALEYEDKFNFANLRGYSMETTKYLAEKLPTWVGNIVVENVGKYGISDEDLAVYEAKKEMGIRRYEGDKTAGRKRKTMRDEYYGDRDTI